MASANRGRKKKKRGDDGWGEWGGYMAAKVQKLQDQVNEDIAQGLKSNIFQGVSIFVNGYTKPTAADLKQLVVENGGVFHHYYRRELVTHIIASNLPNSKMANITDKKVCTPAWITDSVAANHLLPYQKYLLVSSRSHGQTGLNFNKLSATSSTGTDVTENNSEKMPSDDIETETIEPMPSDDMETETISTNIKDGKGECELTIEMVDAATAPTGPARTSESTDNSPPSNTSDSFRSPSKAGDPNFLTEFYTHSRLHHLSTWGAEFKAYVTRLQQDGDPSFPGREKLRDLVNNRVDGGDDSSKSRLSLTRGKSGHVGKLQRTIMHVDMDCFFVSVGLRNRPELKGKPVAVTHSRGKGVVKERPGTNIAYERQHYRNKTFRGKKTMAASNDEDIEEPDDLDTDEGEGHMEHQVITEKQAFQSMAEIASCSYEARNAGVKNGMFMGSARQLCPDLVPIPYDFEGYNEVSCILYDTVATYTHDIEAVSCDEMLVDCTDLLADTGATATEFASLLRHQILNKTKCNASAGIGPNILVARLATKKAKPDGQFYVCENDVADFIKDITLSSLPGVGRAVGSKLAQLGAITCGDLQTLTMDGLQRELGPKTGLSLYNFCRGVDKRLIKMEKERKSVSAEVNYGIRFTQDYDVEKFITGLSEEVSSRLQKISVKGKTITMKVKVRKKDAPKETVKFLGHGVCDNVAKSTTIALATDNPKVIAREALSLVHVMNIQPEDYRGLGIQMSRLETPIGTRGQKGTPSILQFTTSKPHTTVQSGPQSKTYETKKKKVPTATLR